MLFSVAAPALFFVKDVQLLSMEAGLHFIGQTDTDNFLHVCHYKLGQCPTDPGAEWQPQDLCI